MKCPYCNKFKGNPNVRGYTVKEQLHRHLEVKHDIIGIAQFNSKTEPIYRGESIHDAY